jgi:hypothetical protein
MCTNLIETTDPDVILGSVFGEDVALTQFVRMCGVACGPNRGGSQDSGWLAVHVPA